MKVRPERDRAMVMLKEGSSERGGDDGIAGDSDSNSERLVEVQLTVLSRTPTKA